MADQTTASITVDAAPADVMAVIADFEAYPQWSEAVKEVSVLEIGADERPVQVWFRIDSGPLKDAYVLAYDWQADESVSWRLVESKLLKALDGSYQLIDRGDGTTEVTYRLVADVNLPMLGMFKRKAEKVIIDTALNELKKRVEG
jgi:ribosome-associated toxin RatA of RatAB toxin-antitoxin module